jgi:hypothetical protein
VRESVLYHDAVEWQGLEAVDQEQRITRFKLTDGCHNPVERLSALTNVLADIDGHGLIAWGPHRDPPTPLIESSTLLQLQVLPDSDRFSPISVPLGAIPDCEGNRDGGAAGLELGIPLVSGPKHPDHDDAPFPVSPDSVTVDALMLGCL